MRMSDALAANKLNNLNVIVLLCWAHARRKFYEIKDSFPDETQKVLEIIGTLYHLDAEIRRDNLDDIARMELHKTQSLPLLEALKTWLLQEVEQKRIEPKGELGKAVKYLMNHWANLINFCFHPGAPLDNNLAERLQKIIILVRKNSLFFKTMHGATVGCMLVGLLATVKMNKGNPFEYIVALIENSRQPKVFPAVAFMPWSDEPLTQLE
jgi:hypothetical protein